MRRLAVLAACVLALGACADRARTVAEKPAVGVEITSPQGATTTKGNVVVMRVSVRGIRLVGAAEDPGTGGTGHLHFFIDREPTPAGQPIPREKGIIHSAKADTELSGLSIGRHKVTAVLGDKAHVPIAGAGTDAVEFTTEGPTVTASATAAGGTVTVRMTVEGVQLVKADQDPGTGGTGHLHLFVDRDPTPAGQAIPKEAGIIHTTDLTVQIPGLAAGEHKIVVVVGDRSHVPLDPPVRATATVTIA